MSKNKALRTIIYQCDAEDGFLVQLRSWRKFQQEKYQELIGAIKTYRDAIASERTIDRKVAGSLHRVHSQNVAGGNRSLVPREVAGSNRSLVPREVAGGNRSLVPREVAGWPECNL